MSWFLKIIGRGNAWPVPLGQEHPFYMKDGKIDYANASFSIMEYAEGSLKSGDSERGVRSGDIAWELLIDAGHGTVPFLLNNNNRIPEAIFITHPHFDHILGIDWIAQSYYRFNDKKKYPLYATRPCWDTILDAIPHLEEIIEFRELKFREAVEIPGTGGVKVTAFPVYHGEYAKGASMFLFDSQILFTGDVLVPLLEEEDLERLAGVDYLVADSNNRFPYPGSNHWSLAPGIEGRAERLEEFAAGEKWKGRTCLTVFDFIQKISPGVCIPVHYSGQEDMKYYGEELLDEEGLQEWLDSEAERHCLSTKFIVPLYKQMFELNKTL